MARRWTVGEQLGQARRRRFVGRRAELELFAAALSATEPPFTVLHVHGPGGVGKTALLQGFAEVARTAGAVPVRLDARHCEPTPAGLLGGLRQALELPEDGSPIEALALHGQAVLLVDTYETAAAADDWVREELLPGLPAAPSAGAGGLRAGPGHDGVGVAHRVGHRRCGRAVHVAAQPVVRRAERPRADLARSGTGRAGGRPALA